MNPPFAQGPSRYMVVGTTNSGKTMLACRIIRKMLVDPQDPRTQLVIVSPNYHRDSKLKSLAEFAAQNGLVVKVFLNFDKATMKTFVDTMDKCALAGMRSTIFIDDPVGVGSFTSNVNQASPFNSFVSGLKHYNSDIVFSTQSIGAMSRSARKNVEVFIYLPDMVSREELYKACRFVRSQEDFDKLMDAYTSQSFNALWINVQYGRKGVYHINPAGQISSITAVPQ